MPLGIRRISRHPFDVPRPPPDRVLLAGLGLSDRALPSRRVGWISSVTLSVPRQDLLPVLISVRAVLDEYLLAVTLVIRALGPLACLPLAVGAELLIRTCRGIKLVTAPANPRL